MRDSAALHPNLRRLIVDDDCIFLLCTDGLSDFDRVEQQWRRRILPVLHGQQDLASAVKNLIALANAQNGHDNVTVALVRSQVKALEDRSQLPVPWSAIEPILAESNLWSEQDKSDPLWSYPASESAPPTTDTISETQIGIGEPLSSKKQPGWIKTLIFVLLISTIIGLFAYKLLQDNLDKKDSDLQPSILDTTEVDPTADTEE